MKDEYLLSELNKITQLFKKILAFSQKHTWSVEECPIAITEIHHCYWSKILNGMESKEWKCPFCEKMFQSKN